MQRADKRRNVDKVAAALVKNPLATEKQIADEVKVSPSTAHLAKKEVEGNRVKDPRIVSVTDTDMEILTLAQ